MPRLKKAVSKKSSANATAKRGPKKMAKSTHEGAALHQAFVASLATIENYWNKKSSALKKQLDTLRVKHGKAVAKSKAAKGKTTTKGKQAAQGLAEQAAALQAEVAQIRANLAQAKLAMSQYAALSKQLHTLERQQLKEILEEPQTASSKKSKPAGKKAAEEASAPKKRGRKPKQQTSAKAPPTGGKKRGRKPKEASQVEMPEDFLAEDELATENSAPVTKKRGPKAKKKASPVSSLTAVEEDNLAELADMEPEALADFDEAEDGREGEFYEDQDLPELFATEQEFNASDEDDESLDDFS